MVSVERHSQHCAGREPHPLAWMGFSYLKSGLLYLLLVLIHMDIRSTPCLCCAKAESHKQIRQPVENRYL